MAAAASRRVGKLVADKTVFFECDIQERFRDLIYNMPAVISTAKYVTFISVLSTAVLYKYHWYPYKAGDNRNTKSYHTSESYTACIYVRIRILLYPTRTRRIRRASVRVYCDTAPVEQYSSTVFVRTSREKLVTYPTSFSPAFSPPLYAAVLLEPPSCVSLEACPFEVSISSPRLLAFGNAVLLLYVALLFCLFCSFFVLHTGCCIFGVLG